MFCPKCGSILRPKSIGGKNSMACSCGYVDKKGESRIKESISKKEERAGEVAEDTEVLPVTEANCPKCGNNKAYNWSIHTRAADEAETQFFRCTKCRHTWREYD